MSENFLIISDPQIPFHEPRALDFCLRLKREFRVESDHVICVGDELDQYWGGLWDKDPDASMTANQEIEASRIELKRWYKAFPEMMVCESNHGTRWKRKATHAQIPSQLLRLYRDIIEAPEGWRWQKHWKIKCKYPFLVEHGDDWGGQHPHVKAALHNGISTAIGHHHSKAGTHWLKTNEKYIWGMVTGCLIDFDQFAFEYARSAAFKPLKGAGIVLDSGRTPLWLPFE